MFDTGIDSLSTFKQIRSRGAQNRADLTWQEFSIPVLRGTQRRDCEIAYNFCGYTLPRSVLGARSAASISPDAAAASPENRQLSNGTNHVSCGGSVPSDRRRPAGFFQAAG